jgi:hypothetical protein
LEEENAKTQGRKDAKVVDLPQRSGCLDFSPEGDTSLPLVRKPPDCAAKLTLSLGASGFPLRALGASVFRSLIPPSTRYRSQPCTSNFLAVGCGLNEIAPAANSSGANYPGRTI